MEYRPKILIIDDVKEVCDFFKKILTPENYLISSSLDGASGLEMIEKERPDVILLDVKMPKMDGIEVLRRIKKIDKNIVVIMITAYGTMDTARMAMKLGAFDYITKPFDLEYVKAVIKDGLEMTLHALAQQMKEKRVLKDIRFQQAMFAKLKHCKGTQACLWEVALRAFVLNDDDLMMKWMENSNVSKEEKIELTKIAQILMANMATKTK